ncbi:MAG: hypothetical protein QM722_10420 [Piscinibacter sp.]
MNDAQLNARLRSANPVPGPAPSSAPGVSLFRRIGQIVLAVLAVLLVGVGVAWAASGTNPIASVFADDLKVVESDVGFDWFEILEPMTQEDLATLPAGAAQAATFHAISKQTMENTMNGLPPFGRDKSKFEPDPAFISAIGRGETNTGNPVTLLVEGDEVCSYAGEKASGEAAVAISSRSPRAKSSAGDPSGETTASASLPSTTTTWPRSTCSRIPNHRSRSPTTSWNSAICGIQDITLVGLDDEGNELFRDSVPMSMKP